MTYKRVEHIAAGHFKAERNVNDIFQAYLGTCVGVALYDPKTKVGGLIHILLPEPPSFSSTLFQEKYATTGIPMFVRKLIELGADPASLEASIAGGALVGPVSQQDMNLDIGGRTADIAQSLLSAAGIQTIRSETGGFFTCTLELDLATGKTRIQPAWEDTGLAENNFASPSLEDILQTIEQLKPIPQTALKIFRMFKSGMGGITDIAHELGKDQVLSGQVLKVCNSALFSGTGRVDSLKDAVLLMGEDMLIKSVVTAAVNNYYGQTGTSGYSLCRGGLFFHAVGVAAMADQIAVKSGTVQPKLAYTAGLLHDIGKVILDQFVAEASPLFFRNLSLESHSFIDTEKKLLGISHAEAGSLLARKWKFSDSLNQVIRFHHNPSEAEAHHNLVFTIYLADLIIEKFSSGFDLEKMKTDYLETALTHLGLDVDVLPELVDTIPVKAFSPGEW